MSVPYIIHIQSCFFIGFKKTPILNFQVKTHRAVHFNGRDWARTLTLFVKQKASKISQQARASLQLEPPHPTTITVHTGTTTRRHQFFCWSFPLHHHPSSRKTAAAFLPNNKQHQQVDSIQFSSLFEFPSRNSFLSPSILPSFFKHINSK
jgi:hypothetical protein